MYTRFFFFMYIYVHTYRGSLNYVNYVNYVCICVKQDREQLHTTFYLYLSFQHISTYIDLCFGAVVILVFSLLFLVLEDRLP